MVPLLYINCNDDEDVRIKNGSCDDEIDQRMGASSNVIRARSEGVRKTLY